MATVDYALTPELGDPLFGRGASYTFAWTLTDTDADGAPIRIGSNVVDITFQLAGTFDGATLVIEGTNDASTWLTHTDLDGSAMSYTSVPSALAAPRELGRRIRPRTSGGGGSQSVVVTATLRVAEG